MASAREPSSSYDALSSYAAHTSASVDEEVNLPMYAAYGGCGNTE